ncbi:hypothetical protein GCM10027275_01710 [Rhabdobacter roseus]|uniref:Outer membrane receptor protein involved in Fe transport n=1 Tax=Rhabdobacter roseus TaxID=1655419 RepID=A0A840TD88_9BACT|nr:carboxypeptidase-like regulatory domain-containing protein [Rhabdobacter roseus]MBB5282056.1 outer membrane receptor protein involved in Fe transport [Rhabdobacter roseus]
MRKYTTRRVFYLLLVLLVANASAALAQDRALSLTGRVLDAASREPLIGVSVQVKGRVIGTITDADGRFSFTTTTPPPFQLTVTSVGYETQEINVTAAQSTFEISLREQAIMGQEVIVSASRVEESVMKSPVAVERMDIRAIRETPAANFYDGLANLKGIDMATQGMLFKSINMRGFGATGNPRMVQMIDGMDNSAPGLNFPVDNIVGMPELDVESVDILPGAASALYGPNAINGLVLMNSKSPFLYQGLSATLRGGLMHEASRAQATTPFTDVSVRYAKAFNDRLAFKVNFSYLQAKDWEATNYANLNVGGNADPNRGAGTKLDYDGVNVYGDEAQANINTVALALAAQGLLPAAAVGLVPSVNVSRTGILERDLVDYNTRSFKFNGGLHYRVNDKIEAVAQLNYGYGTTVYTGTGRYALRNFNITQGKLELRGDNFTLRAYTTQERSGDSYTAGLAAVFLNEAWKPSSQWFGQYTGAFAQARAQGVPEAQAHLAARGVADTGRPIPGTEAYSVLYERVRNTAINEGGGAFSDKSNLYHAEGLYNFKNEIKFVEILAGANYRLYELRSAGTLFADQVEDRNGKITIGEYGGFVQAGKNLLQNHLRLTGSIRYDKNQNFKGQFTPRVSAVTTFGEHNIRLSYQTGFRIPTTQNQYIDLLVPNARLIGGLPEFVQRYGLNNAYTRENVAQYGDAVLQGTQNQAIQQQATQLITQQVTAAVTGAVQAAVAAGQIPNDPQVIQGAIAQGVQAQLPAALQQNLATAVQGLAALGAIGMLTPYQPKEFKPERVANYEIGYRGLIGRKLFVDAYYYFSEYTNFIGNVILLKPTASIAPGLLPEATGVLSGNTRQVYSRPTNSSEKIRASGWALGLNYALPHSFNVGANIANNELRDFVPSPEVQFSGFNTPTYRYNLSFGRRISSSNRLGFNLAFRHQDAFLWEAGFVQPSTAGVPLFGTTRVPAINNLDAQVSLKIPSIKSIVKVGGTNLTGKTYFQAYGSAMVGSTFYVSLTFDELLN